MRWRDRQAAGQQLAKKLSKYQNQPVVVYGLPRGGVVVAAEVARALNAPLEPLIARKIGHPHHSEYAIGAVTEHGQLILSENETAGLSQSWLSHTIKQQRIEAKRRRALYPMSKKPMPCKGKTAIIVDDGIATGLTLRAALAELKTHQPSKIIVAVPVAPDDSAAEIEAAVDELICLVRDKYFLGAVGNYYDFFNQVEDNEVIDILSQFEDD